MLTPQTRKGTRQRSISCGILIAMVITFQSRGQGDQELWYRAPAKEWTEAMPVGNGRLGAMVFGTYPHEHIQLNEESLWAGSKLNNNNPEARAHLSAIQQAVFDGEHQKVWEMADKYLLGTPPQIRSYQPLGNLSIHYVQEGVPSHYRRSLNLHSGVARAEYFIGQNKIVQEVFISAPDDVIIVTLRATKAFDTDVLLNRDRDTHTYGSVNDIAWFEGQIRDQDHPKKGPGGNHMRFSAAMKVHLTDGRTVPIQTDSTAGYRILGAQNVTILLTGATDYDLERLDVNRSVDPLSTCRQLLVDAARLTSEQLRQRHEQDHRAMFERLTFSLGEDERRHVPTDERIEKVRSGEVDLGIIPLYYQYGRYLLMGSSRKPGRLPSNLQGVWNHLYEAKWNSDFHTNINLQMNYWPAETANLSETSEVLAEFVKQITIPGGITAKEMYGARGWTVHHLTDVFGRTGVADGVWGFSPMAGAWMTFPVYRHYEFTGDISYLRDIAYPVMKGSVLFVLDFLIESPEGYLVTNPSHSPENPFVVPGTEGKEKAYLSYATTIDNQIIQAMFNNFIEAARILDKDQDVVDQVVATEKKLPPMKIGSNGTLQEWIHDYEEFEPGHRHISHLLGLYPLHLITPKNPQLFEAARKTIERRMVHSQRHVGWSSAWIINFYARLHDGEKAGAQVQRLLQYSTLGSLLNSIPPFQIDGNFGGAAGIAEMLLQSHDRVIHVLPALPTSWREGTIAGLRARGNYTIDMSWRAGVLKELVIHAGQAGKCRIRYRNRDVQIALRKGRNIFSARDLFK